MATRFHRIFTATGNTHVADVDWADDPNHGLPPWFFEGTGQSIQGDYVSVEIDTEKDTVEFVPAIGPAPIWSAKYSSFADDDALVTALGKWCREMF